MKVPVLMITWNRLEYTKKALAALTNCEGIIPVVIDNGSDDGTIEWLESKRRDMTMIFNGSNLGIAHAMNQFIGITTDYPIIGKVDNDTVVSHDWVNRMLPYMKFADIIQSRHHIIEATCPGGWNMFVRNMRYNNGLYYNHFVGGSGILFNREKVSEIPETEWKLGGWREFQKRHPELKKGFVNSVDISLLDEHGYNDYPEYYQQTGRLATPNGHTVLKEASKDKLI